MARTNPPADGAHDTPAESLRTHFGFTQVPVAEKQKRVASVFTSVASKYGTGDLTREFAKAVGPKGLAILSDINAAMLGEGRTRLADKGVVSAPAVQLNAERIPFAENTFDCITIGFGLRNVTDKDKALASMTRALKPGGRLFVLEFSKPLLEPLAKVYDQYSFKLLPLMGRIVANDADSYRYLAESIRMHPDQDTLKGMMERAGLSRVQVYNLTGGIVAVHRGFKLD